MNCSCEEPDPNLDVHTTNKNLKPGWCKKCYNSINRQSLIKKCDSGCEAKLKWAKVIKHKEEEWTPCSISCTYHYCYKVLQTIANTTDQNSFDKIKNEHSIIDMWNEQEEDLWHYLDIQGF